MEEYLIGGSETPSLSGAVMEALGGVIPFLAVDRAEIPTLGEVRADQPVGVFSFMPRSQEWSGWAKQTVAPRD